MIKHTTESGALAGPGARDIVPIVAIVLVLGGRTQEVHDPGSDEFAVICPTSASNRYAPQVWTMYDDKRDARQRHRRVFVPTVQLLREQLPEPDI
jgi:hypothetical protein